MNISLFLCLNFFFFENFITVLLFVRLYIPLSYVTSQLQFSFSQSLPTPHPHVWTFLKYTGWVYYKICLILGFSIFVVTLNYAFLKWKICKWYCVVIASWQRTHPVSLSHSDDIGLDWLILVSLSCQISPS